MRFILSVILIDCEVTQNGDAAVFVVYEAHTRNERFNEVKLLKRGDDQQLKV